MPDVDDYGQNIPIALLTDGPPNINTVTDGIVNGLSPRANMTFASSTARSAAIPSPVEGMESWLKDSDTKHVYDGSAWQQVTMGKLPWANVSLASGWSPWVGNTVAPRVRREGSIVYLEGRQQYSSSFAGANGVTIGTVPSSYWPIGHYAEGAATITLNGAPPIGRIEVWHTDGTIRLWTDNATNWVGYSSWWFVT